MTAAPDPVHQGLVKNLGHPGGNFTGFSLQSPDTVGKRLELLKELVPGTAPVAVLWDQSSILDWQATEAAAQRKGWNLLSLEIRDTRDIEGAFRAATGARAGALLAFAAGLLFPIAPRVAELSTRSHLPSMFGLREHVAQYQERTSRADEIAAAVRALIERDAVIKMQPDLDGE